MRLSVLSVCFLLLASTPGYPQPVPSTDRPIHNASTESVTVVGTRSQEAIHDFVQAFTAPTRLTGKIARWENGICPVTVGIRPGFINFVTQRVRVVAATVGAPVDVSATCKPNIEIVFTTKPQALLDNIRKNQKSFLGYYDNQDQLAKLATVTRPIQAWYTTATRDLMGNLQVDGGQTAGNGLDISYRCPPPQRGMCTMHLSNAHAAAVTGTRLGDGLRSDFYHVIIVVNPDQLKDYEIGSLADYISLLALTQLSALDTCQQLPSIVNLLAEGCARKANALTDSDIAYLRGLYKMSSDRTLRTQQDEMAYQMSESLAGRK
jgi:hypothetical protein